MVFESYNIVNKSLQKHLLISEFIAENNESISENNESISEGNESISERNESISGKNESISEENGSISEWNGFISERNESISGKNGFGMFFLQLILSEYIINQVVIPIVLLLNCSIVGFLSVP